MRSGRQVDRWVIGLLALFGLLAGSSALGQAVPVGASSTMGISSGGSPVRLTVEVTWKTPGASPTGAIPPAKLELSQGRFLEAVVWPDDPSWKTHLAGGTAALELGRGQSGQVRVRIEAPIEATLQVGFGDRSVPFPLTSLLDGSQRLAIPNLVEVEAFRVPWDGLEIRLGDHTFDGTAAPGSVLPLLVGTNLLTPEAAELAVELTAELRPACGGDPVWKLDRQAFHVTSNAPPATRAIALPLPSVEGSYTLEVQAAWAPVEQGEGSRLARWWRWRKQPGSPMVKRRLTVSVVGPKGTSLEPPSPSLPGDVLVDLCDLTRPRAQRVWSSGRTAQSRPGWGWDVPEAIWAQSGRFDRLIGLLPRVGLDPGLLGGIDGTGLAWTSLVLKAPHPGRPHRLSVSLLTGHPSALGVALLSWKSRPDGTREWPRVLLDACLSAGPIADGAPPITFSWPVWPDDADPVLVLFNRGAAPVRVGAVELTELAAPSAPETVTAAGREVGLDVSLPRDLERFGGDDNPVNRARNLASHALSCGASFVVLPPGLEDRASRQALEGQSSEDNAGPDNLDLVLRLLDRQGMRAWIELKFEGPLPGLPAADSEQAIADGLVLIDRFGQPVGAAYNPLHPSVREAMARRVAELISARRTRPNLAGLLIRLGPAPTLPGAPDSGLDDDTFQRFVREKLDEESAKGVPGLKLDDPQRFASRHQFLSGAGRIPWLAWRAQQVATLYDDLARKVAETAPGALLAVSTPTLDDGPVGHQARRSDLAGQAPDQAWRTVGLDLAEWPSGEKAPVVLRGVCLSRDDLAHDLATSPELDTRVAARPDRGALIVPPADVIEPSSSPTGTGLRLSGLPIADGSDGAELLNHAVAALDARRIVVADSVVAGREEQFRVFSRVYRSLPFASGPPSPRMPSGVAARAWIQGGATYTLLANDTPYPVSVETTLTAPEETPIEDLVLGGRVETTVVGQQRRATIELRPFELSAWRIASPNARITSVRPRYDESVRALLETQSQDLSVRLSRLARVGGDSATAGPPNAGFEPEGSSRDQEIRRVRNGSSLVGWKPVSNRPTTAEIDLDRPHAGLGSLKLASSSPPAAVVSDAFVPPAGPAVIARFWLRSQPAGASVRFRLDGESLGQTLVRQAEIIPGPNWTEFAIRLEDLPTGGLDRARLRFELLAPGSLWIDDLSLAGVGPTQIERLNARRRTLLAAVQAYRERRYGDFARLAGSHWVRPLPSDPDADAPTARTGDAVSTDLPAGRRLR